MAASDEALFTTYTVGVQGGPDDLHVHAGGYARTTPFTNGWQDRVRNIVAALPVSTGDEVRILRFTNNVLVSTRTVLVP